MKRVWTVRFPLPIPFYGYLDSPPLQLQSNIDPEVCGLTETVCGSGWWGEVAVEGLQSGQLRWWSFGRCTSVCRWREHRDRSSWPSERQLQTRGP